MSVRVVVAGVSVLAGVLLLLLAWWGRLGLLAVSGLLFRLLFNVLTRILRKGANSGACPEY